MVAEWVLMNSLTLVGLQAAVSTPPKIPKTSQMQVCNCEIKFVQSILNRSTYHTIGRGSNDCFNADKDGIGVVAQGTTGFNSAQNVVVAFCAIGDGISFSIFLEQSWQISHQFQAFGHLLKVTFNFESEFS